MRRVLLIANANAHTVTPYARDVISRALAAGTRPAIVGGGKYTGHGRSE